MDRDSVRSTGSTRIRFGMRLAPPARTAGRPRGRLARQLAVGSVGLAALVTLSACAGLPVDVSVPDAVTAPGTSLAIGETARVPGLQWAADGGTIEAEVGLTVLEVRSESAELFDRLDNVGDLDGLADVTPVVVISQVDVAAMDSASGDATATSADHATAPSTGGLVGLLSSGTPAEFLTTTNQPQLCGSPPTDASLLTDVRCTIVLVPAGETLTEIAWGLLPIQIGQTGPEGRTVPYADAPITWTVPAN